MTTPHAFRVCFVALAAASFLPGQSPPTAAHGQVLAILTLNTGMARDQIMKVMPAEVKATVQLYLDGKIRQWYARGDGKGVVFVLESRDVEEAKSLTDELPLIKAGFAEFSFMPIGPLTPLRILLGGPGGASKASP